MQQDEEPARTGGGRPATPWYLRATPLAARPWLIRQRWASVAVAGVVLAAAAALPHGAFALGHLAPLVAASAAANAAIAVTLTRKRPVPPAPSIALLVLDVLLLTGVLELTGGPFNPFAVIYAVHVALAAVSLGAAPALLVAAAAVIGYGVLAWRHAHEGPAAIHHRLSDFPTHLYAMWIALTSLAELGAYVVGRASATVEAMRERAARADRLVSLTTLAAGAAHELSTPLGTIAVAARELELAAARGAPADDLADDARLIRTEVERCRTILDQMSGRAGGITVDEPERLDVRAAVAAILAELPHDAASRIRVDDGAALPPAEVSRAGLRQAVLSLVTNALDASAPGEAIVVEITAATESTLRITVRDRGPGIPASVLARAGEPFFTTKEAGRGLGLGLFLARIFAERHRGALTLHVGDGGRGTVAILELPIAPPPAHAD